ncbi:beta,beta-carotene 15,15'-dioxygenase-like isoform X1 [Eriocheir sinensis]|uniref:beta,beta-carotene 15,15'-dioxygenase-like isoform X1 n=1 Tax=Eriocheir sinensis TaxID=95602 RepID=UPI0021C86F95|nr:beta,beta-carotene 15,15'-dioxygenase-like isoform X1 [Eriocheir sinensis]
MEQQQEENRVAGSEDLFCRNCDKETEEAEAVGMEGRVPEWLEGRVTRNGPGMVQVGATHYDHLFDSLAMLHQFTIQRGRVTYRSRFLRSDSYTNNTQANRIVVGELGTVAFPDPCKTLFHRLMTNFFKLPVPASVMSDNCLVNVCQARDQMFALTETCFLRRLDPDSLTTLGKKEDISNYVAVNMATAHPHIDRDGTVFNVGCSFSLLNGPELRIVRLPEGKLEGARVSATVVSRWRAALPYVHSFAMTKNYWVIVEQPLVLSLGKMVQQYATFGRLMNALTWLPHENLRLLVIDRNTGELLPTTYTGPPILLFHHINAYEKDGHLVVDFSCTNNKSPYNCFFFSNFRKLDTDPSKVFPDAKACRFVLPLYVPAKGEVGEQLVTLKDTTCTAIRTDGGEVHCSPALLCPLTFELPRINYQRNGQPYRYTYGITSGSDLYLQRLIKLDVVTGETWIFHDRGYVAAEPIFVPAPGATEEDDGVVLSTLLKINDLRYVALLVLDARNMKQLARVEFTAEGDVTFPFHGQFVDPRQDVHAY